MTDYVESVLDAIYERGLTSYPIDVGEEGYIFLDVEIGNGQQEALLLDFNEKEHILNVVSHIAGFPTDLKASEVNSLLFIALNTANDRIIDTNGLGRVTLSLNIKKTNFLYVATIPFLFMPSEMAHMVSHAVVAVQEIRDFLIRFCEAARNGSVTVEDAISFPLQEGELRVDLDPMILDLLKNKEEE